MKLFNVEKIIDFIFGISHSDNGKSAYGLTLHLHLLNLDRYTSKSLNYFAFSYPQFSLLAGKKNSGDKLNNLESKLKDAKPPLSPVKKIAGSKVRRITIAPE